MKRYTSWFALAATLALAACQDSAPTGPRAGATPLAAHGDNDAADAPDRGLTSTRGVVPTAYSGNTSGNGSADCAALVPGSTALKVDGATNSQVGGYQFTVSGSGRTTLAFAPVGGGTPTTSIVAVIVKGGPAYDVYRYPGNTATSIAVSSDGNLTSPPNGGGNIPTISHYVVCTLPYTPPAWTLKKEFFAAFGGTESAMIPVDTPVVIPAGEVRWIQFKITWTAPSGTSTAVLTDNGPAACAVLQANGFDCVSPKGQFGDQPFGTYTQNTVGSGSVVLMIDVHNINAPCGKKYPLTNTATLLPTGGTLLTASATVSIVTPACRS